MPSKNVSIELERARRGPYPGQVDTCYLINEIVDACLDGRGWGSLQTKGVKPMFYGQTSNWLKITESVTDNGHVSLPAVAAQYTDNVNAIRVHCGQEMQVQLHVCIYLTGEEDKAAFNNFLERFHLPQNGYVVVNTGIPYNYSASAALVADPQPSQPMMIAPPANCRP